MARLSAALPASCAPHLRSRRTATRRPPTWLVPSRTTGAADRRRPRLDPGPPGSPGRPRRGAPWVVAVLVLVRATGSDDRPLRSSIAVRRPPSRRLHPHRTGPAAAARPWFAHALAAPPARSPSGARAPRRRHESPLLLRDSASAVGGCPAVPASPTPPRAALAAVPDAAGAARSRASSTSSVTPAERGHAQLDHPMAPAASTSVPPLRRWAERDPRRWRGSITPATRSGRSASLRRERRRRRLVGSRSFDTAAGAPLASSPALGTPLV